MVYFPAFLPFKCKQICHALSNLARSFPTDPGSPKLRMVSWNLKIMSMCFVSVIDVIGHLIIIWEYDWIPREFGQIIDSWSSKFFSHQFFVVSITSWPRTMSGEGSRFFFLVGGCCFQIGCWHGLMFWRGCRNHRRWLLKIFVLQMFLYKHIGKQRLVLSLHWVCTLFFEVCLHDFFVLLSPQQKRGGALISNPESIGYAVMLDAEPKHVTRASALEFWWLLRIQNWVVVLNIFYVHPYLGKWSNLTNIFQMGLKPPTSKWTWFEICHFRLDPTHFILGNYFKAIVQHVTPTKGYSCDPTWG